MRSTTPTGSGGLGGLDAPPVVARWGTGHPSAPLVVALHGRGSSESSMIELAPWLPHGPIAYAAVRGPVEEGHGFAWFANRAPGRPDPAGLAASMGWFLRWLDAEGDPERPVILLGYSNGAAFAGALMLSEPERWAAGVLLNGTLPFDAGVPVTRGRLAGMPVFLAHGVDDTVVPPEPQERTRTYLAEESGAPLRMELEPGGHQLAGRIVGEVGSWLGDRLDWLRRHGENPLPDDEPQHWPTITGGLLPDRDGRTAPQLTAPQSELRARIAELAGVRTTAPSAEGPWVFLLDGATGSDAVVDPATGEFARLLPEPGGRLHVVLPDALAYDALARGWAIAHPLAGVRLSSGLVMVAGPRDGAELEIVAGIATAAHTSARPPRVGA